MKTKFLRKIVSFKKTGFAKQIALMAFCLNYSLCSFAQSTSNTAISDAAKAIKNYQKDVKALIYAIAFVIVAVGAFNIYIKMQNGDQDVKKTCMLTIGGCVALVCLAEALPSFFG